MLLMAEMVLEEEYGTLFIKLPKLIINNRHIFSIGM